MRLTNLVVAILALAALVGCSRTDDVPDAQPAPAESPAPAAVETSAPAPAPPESRAPVSAPTPTSAMLGDTAEHVDLVPNLREFAIKKEEVYSRALDHARVNEYEEAMAAFDELIQLDRNRPRPICAAPKST